MTGWMDVALIIVGVAIALVVLIAAAKTGKPLRRIAVSGTQGLCAMGVVDLLGAFTGVSLGFNWLSVSVCAALGLPGVITMLMLKLLLPV